MSDDIDSVVSLREVTCSSQSHLEDGMQGVSLDIKPGELALVQRDARIHNSVLFDLVQGLRSPDRGQVEFRGRDWSSLSIFDAARQRGWIGRVFETIGWISNLDVHENIVLSQRHHTSRPDRDIMQEATALVRDAGFSEMPSCRPHLLRRDELMRAQWVRAFLGRPALVLLERPELDVHHDDLERLAQMIAAGRAGGTAVVWLSPSPALWQELDLEKTRRFDLRERRLIEIAGEQGHG
jgi:phospholipid/cholesterol/gamma-HCH transport system ATP-binding protein